MKCFAHASFGELLQGKAKLPTHGSANDFLFTLPIELYSHAVFYPDPQATTLSILPLHKHKLTNLLNKFKATCLNHAGDSIPQPAGVIEVTSDIPQGKGLAGSSADLYALLQCLIKLYDRRLAPNQLYHLLCQVEPSDAIIHSSITACLHKQGSILKTYPSVQSFTLIGIDEGYELDTITYNSTAKFDDKELDQYTDLYHELDAALRQHDLYKVGKISTQSASMNQSRNPKKYLELLKILAEKFDSFGIVTAHSGSMSAIMFNSQDEENILRLIDELDRNGIPSQRYTTIGSD